MPDRAPNIVWVMCDQMRYDAAGFAGNPIVQTPVLDRMAEEGVCFENAYCASPVCSPARASWLTGLYPHAHLQLRNYGPRRGRTYGSHLPEDTVTLPDLLHDAGYRCGMVGPWHLGDDHLPQHGFTCWQPYRYLGPDYPDPLDRYYEDLGIPNLYGKVDGTTQHGNTLEFITLTDPRQQRTTWTTDRAIDFLDQPYDDPFFLFLSVKDPHPRMVVPPDLIDLYDIDSIPIPSTLRDTWVGKPDYHRHGKFRIPESVTDDQIREMTAYYYALVTHIDTQVGRLLNRLVSLGIRENTLVVFMSDHGELLGDHGYTEKCFMYESSVRVPCVMSWPGVLDGGQRVTTPLGGVDLMPTLLELAGLDPADRIDGRSVAQALRSGVEPDPVPVLAEIASQGVIYRGEEAPDGFAAHVMILEENWKYVRNRFETDELYDLGSDPDETMNLADDPVQAERIGAMRRTMREIVNRTGPGPYEWCCDP